MFWNEKLRQQNYAEREGSKLLFSVDIYLQLDSLIVNLQQLL